MSNKVLMIVLAALHDWQMRADLYGTAALLCCAGRAIELEKRGDPWSAFRVCQEYAKEQGFVQHSVWVSICYALERSKGPRNPAAAVKTIVKRAYECGYIDGKCE